MTFDELLIKVKKIAEKNDVSGKGPLSAQINVVGNNGGVFSVVSKDGRVNVEQKPYIGRDCEITITMDDLNRLIDGKLDPLMAFTFGKLKFTGDMGKALEIAELMKTINR